MQYETECYNTLVNDGGRPSHPIRFLEHVVRSPGRYREILSFWQDHPDEWRVFGKQSERWRDFRRHQRSMREDGRFAEYAADAKDRLARHNFTRLFRLNEDLNQQNRLMTWIEYLNYEYRIRNNYMHSVQHDQSQYDNAWKDLLDSNVLDPSETENTICATQSVNKRLATEKDLRTKRDRFHFATCELRGLTLRSREDVRHLRLAAAKAKRDEAELTLSALKRRTDCVAKFMRATGRYQKQKGKAERCTILLRWILEQIPLIELKMNPLITSMDNFDTDPAGYIRRNSLESPLQAGRYDPASLLSSSWPMWIPEAIDDVYSHLPLDKKSATSPNSDRTSTALTFHPFQCLPNEIRFRIWEDCLPPRPTVHFFDLINRPLARHHQHLWSNKEFRLRASRDHESGYLHVLPLMGTCKEARAVVASYYRRPSPRCFAADGVSRSQTSGSNTGTHSQRDLAPLDWIPVDDLVVLCLPPRPDSRFPAMHDITLAGRPNVGFAVPSELLLCADTIAALPLLLRELVFSEPPRTYLLSRLQAFKQFRPSVHRSWIRRDVHWSGDKVERWRRGFRPWGKVVGADAVERQCWPGSRDERRWVWWVGGDGNAAVGMLQTEDVVGGRTYGKMLEFENKAKLEGQKH